MRTRSTLIRAVVLLALTLVPRCIRTECSITGAVRDRARCYPGGRRGGVQPGAHREDTHGLYR